MSFILLFGTPSGTIDVQFFADSVLKGTVSASFVADSILVRVPTVVRTSTGGDNGSGSNPAFTVESTRQNRALIGIGIGNAASADPDFTWRPTSGSSSGQQAFTKYNTFGPHSGSTRISNFSVLLNPTTGNGAGGAGQVNVNNPSSDGYVYWVILVEYANITSLDAFIDGIEVETGTAPGVQPSPTATSRTGYIGDLGVSSVIVDNSDSADGTFSSGSDLGFENNGSTSSQTVNVGVIKGNVGGASEAVTANWTMGSFSWSGILATIRSESITYTSSSFTADAWIYGIVPVTFTADAVLKRTMDSSVIAYETITTLGVSDVYYYRGPSNAFQVKLQSDMVPSGLSSDDVIVLVSIVRNTAGGNDPDAVGSTLTWTKSAIVRVGGSGSARLMWAKYGVGENLLLPNFGSAATNETQALTAIFLRNVDTSVIMDNTPVTTGGTNLIDPPATTRGGVKQFVIGVNGTDHDGVTYANDGGWSQYSIDEAASTTTNTALSTGVFHRTVSTAENHAQLGATATGGNLILFSFGLRPVSYPTTNFTADSWFDYKATFTADAVIKKTVQEYPFTTVPADAIAGEAVPSSGYRTSFTADAAFDATTFAFTANATLLRIEAVTFTADAVIRTPDVSSTFTADAIFKRTVRPVGAMPVRFAMGATTNSGDGDAAMPAGVQAGDIGLWHMQAAGAPNQAPPTISGWTLITPWLQNGSANQIVYFRILDGTETGTLAGNWGTSSVTDLAKIVVYRGVNLDDPLQAIVTDEDTNTAVRIPTAITPTPNTLLVAMGGRHGANTVSFTGETGGDWVEIYDTNESTGTNSNFHGHEAEMVAAGTISGATSSNNTFGWTQVVIGLNAPYAGFTADAVLKGTIEVTFTADAVLDAGLTEVSATFTADSIILVPVSNTFTGDAYLVILVSGSFTADSVLLKTASVTFTADSYLVGVVSDDFAADAVLLSTAPISFTADAWIVNIVSDDFAADAVLKATLAANYTADAVLKNTSTITFTANAVILRVEGSAFTADSRLLKVQSASFTADAVLLKTVATSFIAYDLFGRTLSNSWGTADVGGTWTTTLQTGSSDVDVDGDKGLLLVGVAGQNTQGMLNSVAQRDVDITVTTSINKIPTGGSAFLHIGARATGTAIAGSTRYIGQIEVTTSGLLNANFTKSVGGTQTSITSSASTGITVAANQLFKVRYQAEGASPTTLRIKVWLATDAEPGSWLVTNSSDSEATLQSTGGLSLRLTTAGALSNAPITVGTTAYEARYLTIPGPVLADAYLVIGVSGSFTANASLIAIVPASFTANSYLVSTAGVTFAADAVLKGTITQTFAGDSVIKAPVSGSFSADAVLLLTETGSVVASAILRDTESVTFTADATLLVIGSDEFAADAILRATLAGTFTADAVLLGAVESTFSADSTLLIVQSGSFSADAILLVAGEFTFTADAVILFTIPVTFTVDARISPRPTRVRPATISPKGQRVLRGGTPEQILGAGEQGPVIKPQGHHVIRPRNQ